MTLLLDTRTGHVCRLKDYEWDAGMFCHRLSLVTMTGATLWRTSHQVEVLPNNVIPFPVGDQSPLASRRKPSPESTSFGEGALSNYGDV